MKCLPKRFSDFSIQMPRLQILFKSCIESKEAGVGSEILQDWQFLLFPIAYAQNPAFYVMALWDEAFRMDFGHDSGVLSVRLVFLWETLQSS